MKRESQHSSSGKLHGLFCLGLAAVLAAAVVLNTMAANTPLVHYDVSVHSSSTHTIAQSGGELWFWGTNESGQFPGCDLVYSPEPVKLLDDVLDAAVADNATLIVTKDHFLRAYGLDLTTGERLPADGIVLGRDVAQVETGGTFCAYISTSGALYTWGKNDAGQLGNGAEGDVSRPELIIDGGVKKVSLGIAFGLALMDDGTVRGWGSNGVSQTGYEQEGEDVSVLTVPVQVADHVKDIAAGDLHACMLKENGTLWTCGDNSYSQTGVGPSVSSNGLTQILSGVLSVSAGGQHNFAVAKGGTVYAWGYGAFGQLGNGETERLPVPTASKYKYVQVFACGDNTFGVTPEGNLCSFGSNNNYRLGKSDGSDSLLPMRILDKNMNWIYPQFKDEPLPDQNGSGNKKPNNSGSGNVGIDTPVVETPTVVAEPFVHGYPDGTFKPGVDVKRSEFLTMLVASKLCPDFDNAVDYGSSSFSDVPVDAWYGAELAYAQQKKLVYGYPDGTFGPEEYITRAEASIMIARAMSLNVRSGDEAPYSDLIENSDANKYIAALSTQDVLSGYPDGTFRPELTITRAEAATAVARACGFKPTDEQKAEFNARFTTSPFEDVVVGEWYYAYILRAVGYADVQPAEE